MAPDLWNHLRYGSPHWPTGNYESFRDVTQYSASPESAHRNWDNVVPQLAIPVDPEYVHLRPASDPQGIIYSLKHGGSVATDQDTPRRMKGKRGLRSSRSSRNLQYDDATRTPRRQGGVIDHDPTEGLPVRKWEQQYVTIKQNQKSETEQVQGPNPDYPWPELPLPKDFHQLPPHSQEMLRRARMGNRAKQTFSSDPRAGVPEEDLAMEDGENKPPVVEEDRSYTVRRWVPARVEKPDVKYLADRRPGLPPLYGITSYNEVAQPAKKMVKVRTTDPVTGQQRIYDTMILEGGEDGVDGEIITEEEAAAALAASSNPAEVGESVTPAVVAEALAPGTVIEGVGVVNEEGVVIAPSVTAAAQAIAEATPIRRRPPPPKRKKHGPGRGRKKKVMFAPGEGAEVQPGATASDQPALADGDKHLVTGTDDATPMNLDGTGEDREDSNIPDEGEGDDDEEDDEEGSEDGEIEEDGEEGQTEDITQDLTQDVKMSTTTVEPVEEVSRPSAAEEVPTATSEPTASESTQLPPEEPVAVPTTDSGLASISAPPIIPEPAPTTTAPTAFSPPPTASTAAGAESESQPEHSQEAPPPTTIEAPSAESLPPAAPEPVPTAAYTDEAAARPIPPPIEDSHPVEMDLLGSLEQTLETEEDVGGAETLPPGDGGLLSTAASIIAGAAPPQSAVAETAGIAAADDATLDQAVAGDGGLGLMDDKVEGNEENKGSDVATPAPAETKAEVGE